MKHTLWPAWRVSRVLAAPMVLAGVLAGLGPAAASAAGCQSWTGGQPPSPGTTDNRLNGVTVLSPCDAWAVGSDLSGGVEQPLIEHWDGSSWTVVPSPSPGSGALDVLHGVRAVSATDIWAVGFDLNSGVFQPLIEHWDGSSWTVVPGPSLGNDSQLHAVRVVSASDVWAVGTVSNGTAAQTLILHWNGTAWKRVASPDPGGPGNDNELFGVAATSASNAWAAGDFANGPSHQTLILRWNGTSWKRVASPNLGSSKELNGVAASSAASAWAVGDFSNNGPAQALALHCC